MGSMQTYGTVHMVTDGNNNSNGIIVKWVVDPFVMARAMERNSANTYVAIAIATTMSYVCIEPIHDDKDAVAIAIHFVWTDQQRNRCRCLHSMNEP